MQTHDKKLQQPEPEVRETVPENIPASSENNQEGSDRSDEPNNGDYVVVGSGLGIDE